MPATLSGLPQEIRKELRLQLQSKPVAAVPSLGLVPQLAVACAQGHDADDMLAIRRRAGVIAQVVTTRKRLAYESDNNPVNIRQTVMGFIQGAYTFDRYKSAHSTCLKQCDLLGISGRAARAAVREGEIIGNATSFCRDLINTPAADLGPADFVREAKKACKGTGLRLRILDEAACQKKKMGALLAVGAASAADRRARLLVVEWNGKNTTRKKDFIALCGKGVVFDTGGLNIKPGRSMQLMRKDMGGAATVLSAMIALAQLNGKQSIRAYLPLVENSISAEAFRPGDVLTAADGTTIEIGNTDAEGRLALADAMCLAKQEGAQKLVTVATLTGAAMVALGRIHVPIMGDQDIVDQLSHAATSSGEKVWQLPMDDDHKTMVRGKMADLTNSDGSGEAGCITAGAFLSYFAGNLPFAHCDISPASWQNKQHALGPAGATGVLVSTLVDAFR